MGTVLMILVGAVVNMVSTLKSPSEAGRYLSHRSQSTRLATLEEVKYTGWSMTDSKGNLPGK